MRRILTPVLLASASVFALGSGAQAQGLEEIVVTARRVEESAQVVPIAITAFTPETIQQRDIRSVADLQYAVPGLSMCCSRTSTAFSWIRGIPGVITYFASAPVSPTGTFLFFDLANIQALKGPQGTLFGLSANAGALLYEPRRPGPEFGGEAQVTIGGYGRRDFQAAVDLPVSDKLLLRVAGQTHDADGYIYDVITGENRGSEHDWAARFSAVFQPTDDLENYLVFNYGERDDGGDPRILIDVNPTSTAATFFPQMLTLLAQQRALGVYKSIEGAVPGGLVSWAWQANVVNQTTWQVSDNLSLKNTFAYAESRSFSRGEGSTDGMPLPIFGGGDIRNVPLEPETRMSEEFQIIGDLFDSNLKYQLGTFHSWIERDLPDAITYSTSLGSTTGARASNSSRTHALYGQGTYGLSEMLLDGLSLTAGYRYSWDHRTQFQQNYTGVGVPTGAASDRKGKWKAGSWTFSAAYEFDDSKMLYATYAKGYSSGGFNNPLAIPSQQVFDPESLTNLEVGIKADWDLGGGVLARTNLSGFYGWYDDVQVQQTSTIINAAGVPTIAVLTLNAATGHIKGIDAEVTLVPTDWLELSGAFVYVKTGYKEFFDIRNGVVVDLSATPFPYVPEFKYTIRGTVKLPIDPSLGELSLTADLSWEDEKVNTAIIDPNPIFKNPAMTDLKLTLDWKDIAGKEGLDVAVFGTNLTGEKLSTGVVSVYHTPLGFHSQGVLRPRTWGVRARYAFN